MPKIRSKGKFPEGRLTSEDEGELAMMIIRKNGKIVIDFGKSVAWIGMNPGQAIKLGELLIKRGKELLS